MLRIMAKACQDVGKADEHGDMAGAFVGMSQHDKSHGRVRGALPVQCPHPAAAARPMRPGRRRAGPPADLEFFS